MCLQVAAMIVLIAGLCSAAVDLAPGEKWNGSVLLDSGVWADPAVGPHVKVLASSVRASLPEEVPPWAMDQASVAGNYWATIARAPQIEFVRGDSSAEIQIKFCRSDSDLPAGTHLYKNIVAFAIPKIDTHRQEIAGATVVFNLRDFEFADRCDPVAGSFGNREGKLVAFPLALVHELGHCLGLGDGPGQCRNIMEPIIIYVFVDGRRPCKCLTEAGPWDVQGMRFLYGNP